MDTHPYFEKGELSFRFSVTDDASLQEALRRLEKIGRDPSFRRLLNPLDDKESSQ